MTHHHHRPGHAHPSPAIPPSLLRLSVLHRLGAAVAVAAMLWAAVFWAMT